MIHLATSCFLVRIRNRLYLKMKQYEDILNDLQLKEQKFLMSPFWRRIILITCFFLFVFAVSLAALNFQSSLKIYTRYTLLEFIFRSVIAYGLVLPVISLVVALLASLIPIKGYVYRERYWPFALVIIVIVEFFLVLGLISYYFISPKLENKSIQLEAPK